MNKITDIISAQSTPPGKGGVALIRTSGEGAFKIAERIFKPKSSRALSDYPARVQIYGEIIDGDEVLDDVLLTKFNEGSSYTGEECFEICSHGAPLVAKCILELLFKCGAREAEAGEFTRRAFVNGKISLSEAEAVGNLLEAKTREQIRLSSSSQRTLLDGKTGEIRDTLVSLMSSIYARIDYPDEDLGDFSDTEIYSILNNVKTELQRLSKSYKTGRAISEGVSTVIVGKPNVGKSSLYNLLLGEDSAIVTEVRGTTRDVLTSSISLGRVMLNLSDTAGIREGEGVELVERIGIEKSRDAAQKSELVLAVFDASKPLDEDDEAILELVKQVGGARVALLNKCDCGVVIGEADLGGAFDEILVVSAKDGESTDKIAACVNSLFTDEKIVIGKSPLLFTARQSAAVARALESTELAIEALAQGFGQDAIASDIERAISAISELDGREVSEMVVGDIFKKFCVGK